MQRLIIFNTYYAGKVPWVSYYKKPMDARIRYGNEVDILAGVRAEYQTGAMPEYEAIRDMGRTVLSFSRRVENLPDEPEFSELFQDLGLEFVDEKPMEVEGAWVAIGGLRMVEIVNPALLEEAKFGLFIEKLLKLADQKGFLGNNSVHFVDHSKDPFGVYIASR